MIRNKNKTNKQMKRKRKKEKKKRKVWLVWVAKPLFLAIRTNRPFHPKPLGVAEPS